MQDAFQIEAGDNVATALVSLLPGDVEIKGDKAADRIPAIEEIPVGHKIAVRDIMDGEKIIKYGIVIGRATRDIACGQWVHLHCMCSIYDERSSHLDIHTGAPRDIKYE